MLLVETRNDKLYHTIQYGYILSNKSLSLSLSIYIYIYIYIYKWNFRFLFYLLYMQQPMCWYTKSIRQFPLGDVQRRYINSNIASLFNKMFCYRDIHFFDKCLFCMLG